MWMRWCALAMATGLCCVVAGLAWAVVSQGLFVRCSDGADLCQAANQAGQRFAIGLSLFGVIVSSLSTAAVSAFLMREKRPRAGPATTVLSDPFPDASRR